MSLFTDCTSHFIKGEKERKTIPPEFYLSVCPQVLCWTAPCFPCRRTSLWTIPSTSESLKVKRKEYIKTT